MGYHKQKDTHMELILFIVAIITVICAALASRKGRSVAGWAIAGLCFGIFALIVLAILPAKEAA